MLSHKSDKNSIFVVPKGLILFKNNLFVYSINTFFNAKYYRESYQYAEFHLAKLIYNKYFVNIAKFKYDGMLLELHLKYLCLPIRYIHFIASYLFKLCLLLHVWLHQSVSSLSVSRECVFVRAS